MMNKTLKLVVLTALLTLWPSLSRATVSLEGLNLLEDVATSIGKETRAFNIQFRESLGSFKGPVYFPRSIQFDFDNAFIKPAKRIIPVSNGIISQIYIAQINPKQVRLRLMYAEEGLKIRERVRVKNEGRALRVQIANQKKDSLESLLKQAIQPAEAEAETVERESDNAESDLPIPAETMLKGVSADTTPSHESIEAEDKASLPAGKSEFQDLDHLLGRSLIKTDDVQTVSQDVVKTEPVAQTAQAISGGVLSGTGEKSTPPDLTSSAFRMFSALALVLALMFFILFIFKKFVLKDGMLGGNAPVTVLGSGMLAPRKNITLVEIAGEVLVLGVSNDQITLLSRIEDEEKIRKLKDAFAAKSISPAWQKIKARPETAGSALREKGKAAEAFSKYIKNLSSGSKERTPVKEKTSAAEVQAMIQKKLGALRTA